MVLPLKAIDGERVSAGDNPLYFHQARSCLCKQVVGPLPVSHQLEGWIPSGINEVSRLRTAVTC